MQEKEKKTFANMFDKFAMADRKKEALEKQVFESISNMENPSQTNCSNGKNLQMKPDAMNHIDQWSSGGEGSINTDPNSIKVFSLHGRNFKQSVFKVGGDIQMSMDINEAIKEDIQVHPTTS